MIHENQMPDSYVVYHAQDQEAEPGPWCDTLEEALKYTEDHKFGGTYGIQYPDGRWHVWETYIDEFWRATPEAIEECVEFLYQMMKAEDYGDPNKRVMFKRSRILLDLLRELMRDSRIKIPTGWKQKMEQEAP